MIVLVVLSSDDETVVSESVGCSVLRRRGWVSYETPRRSTRRACRRSTGRRNCRETTTSVCPAALSWTSARRRRWRHRAATRAVAAPYRRRCVRRGCPGSRPTNSTRRRRASPRARPASRTSAATSRSTDKATTTATTAATTPDPPTPTDSTAAWRAVATTTSGVRRTPMRWWRLAAVRRRRCPRRRRRRTFYRRTPSGSVASKPYAKSRSRWTPSTSSGGGGHRPGSGGDAHNLFRIKVIVPNAKRQHSPLPRVTSR